MEFVLLIIFIIRVCLPCNMLGSRPAVGWGPLRAENITQKTGGREFSPTTRVSILHTMSRSILRNNFKFHSPVLGAAFFSLIVSHRLRAFVTFNHHSAIRNVKLIL